MIQIFQMALTSLYFLAAISLFIYGLNCYVMMTLAIWGKGAAIARQQETLTRYRGRTIQPDAPMVSTLLPLFNEFNVAERLIRSACAMTYPTGRHEVLVLDDSTDETRDLVESVVRELKASGTAIRLIPRENREGFKAGALANAHKHARGDFLALFDADFVPPTDFLERTIPFFLADSRLGLVQTRWGHLNDDVSLLTKIQSIGMDGHFMVEQSARAWNGLFMNFNGTAGVWRRQAIDDGGGWAWDTLTEDMDLSYRTQMAGWRAEYLADVVVPAEIPEDIAAFKSQQFRWAKGSIQTALKIFPRVLRGPGSVFRKIEAFFHLTHYLVHPLMLTLSLLALPVLLNMGLAIPGEWYALFGAIMLVATCAPSSLYILSQRLAYKNWVRRLVVLPGLVAIGVGLALSNSLAVVQALLGHRSGFVRTPKKGDAERKKYAIRLPWLAFAEIAMGIYCAFSLQIYLLQGKWLIGPFLAVYAAGYLFVGLLTLAHGFGLGGRQPATVSENSVAPSLLDTGNEVGAAGLVHP